MTNLNLCVFSSGGQSTAAGGGEPRGSSSSRGGGLSWRYAAGEDTERIGRHRPIPAPHPQRSTQPALTNWILTYNPHYGTLDNFHSCHSSFWLFIFNLTCRQHKPQSTREKMWNANQSVKHLVTDVPFLHLRTSHWAQSPFIHLHRKCFEVKKRKEKVMQSTVMWVDYVPRKDDRCDVFSINLAQQVPEKGLKLAKGGSAGQHEQITKKGRQLLPAIVGTVKLMMFWPLRLSYISVFIQWFWLHKKSLYTIQWPLNG